MTEREDAIRRIKTVLQLTHTNSLTVTIPRHTAELAVSMLEEQEAVKPSSDDDGGYWCGSCHEDLVWHQKFCSNCGKPVLWEGW